MNPCVCDNILVLLGGVTVSVCDTRWGITRNKTLDSNIKGLFICQERHRKLDFSLSSGLQTDPEGEVTWPTLHRIHLFSVCSPLLPGCMSGESMRNNPQRGPQC